jgi:UDP-N-acetylmuramoyl-L-alanyl-D-glutamate--2,6-diaminopimelate ligase
MQYAASVGGGAIYIDYAHTPDAVSKALSALRPHASGRIILVLGAGGDRDRAKRPLMGRAGAAAAEVVIVTDDNPRSEDPASIRKAIIAGAPNAIEIGDRAEAIAHGVAMLADGDVLLVAGKGHEQGQIVGDRTIPFDDLDVAQRAAANRREIEL